MLILDQTLSFTPEQAKTQCVIPFTLEKSCPMLRIISRYSPKIVSDDALSIRLIREGLTAANPGAPVTDESIAPMLPLNNLITLSLDCENTFVGAAHRHANVQHYEICLDHPSEGFEPFAPRAGQWRAVLSLHAVMVPVVYHLCIEAIEEESL